MDAAQMITSTVMPGSAVPPPSAESAMGGAAPSQLFSEMFAKAALTVGIPEESSGRVTVNEQSQKQQFVNGKIPSPDSLFALGKGTVFSTQMQALFGTVKVPEQGEPDPAILPEGKTGTLLAQAMVLKQTPKEVSLAAEQQGLSLHKGRIKSGEAKEAIVEVPLEEAVQTGSEELPAKDVSVQKKPAEDSETELSRLEIPQMKSADTKGVADLAALPIERIGAMMLAPVVQNIAHVFTGRLTDATGKPELSDVVAVAAQAVTEVAGETFPAVKDDSTARREPRSLAVDGKAGQLLKNAGFVADATKKTEVSFVQSEANVFSSLPDNQGITSFAGGELPAGPVAESGNLKTAGLSVSVTSPDQKEPAEAVPGGEKLFGKVHGKAVQHENVSAIKQPQQDLRVEGKGETVTRELPSGVTVLNPAQTVTMGRSDVSVEVALLAGQNTDRGRVSRSESEAHDEKGRVVMAAGESGKIVLKKEGFSSQDNSNLGKNSENAAGNSGLPQTAVTSGSFDPVIKGQMEQLSEVPREHEVSALHENILSQVREKLVNQDPSGNASKITLKLNPHDLGELQIHVRLEDSKMKVDITAQNPVVKEALLQNLDQLKDTLLRQNISMERFNVSTGNGGGQAFNQSFREGRQTAQQAPDTYSFPMSGYYQEDSSLSQVAFGDARENSLVDMRF